MSLYDEIDAICSPEEDGGLAGWCSQLKGRWLADHILKEQVTHVVELGVFGGRSLLAMALAVKELGRGGFVLGIDPYQFEEQVEGMGDPQLKPHVDWARDIPFETIYQKTLQEIQTRHLSSHCALLRAASQDCACLVGQIDCLHIDACHSVLSSCRDVEVWVPKVRSGGLVVLDDATWWTVQPARQMLLSMCESPISPEEGWEVYRKK